jgi:hypothetical protein
MSYKKNAANNRDALFGGVVADAAAAAPKPARGAAARAPPAQQTSNASSGASSGKGYNRSSKGYAGGKKTAAKKPSLSGEARAAKLKEAEEYKQKANKCMQRGFFAKPDPVAASTFYKRAADAYAAAGEYRMERLYRVQSADCNMSLGAWASAAADYTKAAELVLELGDEDVPDPDQRRRQASEYHKKAATAWTEMNEKAKAAGSQVAAAIALNHGIEARHLSKESLAGMEEAVEAHVPDPLNPYARYRQTGHSAFLDPDSEETAERVSPETREFCRNHIVTRAYSHEPLQQLACVLTEHGEYPSALYAAGAATAVLEQDGLSTLTLSRSYVVETILTLAMGDPVAAERAFLDRHVQKTFYLSSRECQLAEELIGAVRTRDAERLEEVRSPTGRNRAALANLPHGCLRQLVRELRVAGVARKQVPSATEVEKDDVTPAAPLAEVLQKKTGYEQEAEEGAALDTDALSDELGALDFGNDLESSEEEGVGDNGDLDELEDDDIDLR